MYATEMPLPMPPGWVGKQKGRSRVPTNIYITAAKLVLREKGCTAERRLSAAHFQQGEGKNGKMTQSCALPPVWREVQRGTRPRGAVPPRSAAATQAHFSGGNFYL